LTVRLLQASERPFAYDGPRRMLGSVGESPLPASGSWRVSVRCVPLVRRGKHHLEQELRVNLRGGPPGSTVELRLTGPGGDEPRTSVSLDGEGIGTAELWIGEIGGPASARLEVRSADSIVAVGDVVVTPQRRWTVFVVQHSHLDIGYTDRQSIVLGNHGNYLDSVLDLAEATEGWPDDAQFRWTIESAYSAFRWFERRSTAETTALARLCRQGRVELTAFPFQLHTEACSTDELYRLVGLTKSFADRHGLRLDTAMHTDVPGAAAGVVDVLSEAGVRYLSAAHNWAGRSVPYMVGGQGLTRPFWWRSQQGRRLLVWFTDTPHGMAYMEGNIVGLAESYECAQRYLPDYLRLLASQPYPYGAEVFGWSALPENVSIVREAYLHDSLHLRVQGADADNAGPSIVPASTIRRWNDTYVAPRLRSATNREFFADIEARSGDQLAEHEGDWTDWWADGLGSGARPLGANRRAQALLRTAETIDAVAAGCAGTAEPARNEDDAIVLKLGLFDEHTWGAHLPWGDDEDGDSAGALQWGRKSEFAYQALDEASDRVEAAAHRLGRLVGSSEAALASIVVINSVGLRRTELVEAFLPATVVALDTGIEIVDPRTGNVLPHREILVLPEEWPTRPVGRRLELLVADVPACGWARLDVRNGKGSVADVAVGAAEALVGDDLTVAYDLDDVVITSIRQGATELVNQQGLGGANQYIRDRYGTTSGFDHLSGRLEGNLSLLGKRSVARHGVVREAVRTAHGSQLTVTATAEGVRSFETRLRLVERTGRLEIRNRFFKLASDAKESVYFAFPFSHSVAPTAWELTGGIGGSDVPVVPGSAIHVRAIRHWVAFDEPGWSTVWATLEAPLVHFGNIPLPYAPFPPTLRLPAPEPATIYSWALNNIWDTNFPAQQQGETTLTYAIAGSDESKGRVLGASTAAALTDPMVAAVVPGGATAPAAAAGSVVELGNEKVQLVRARASARGLELWLRSLAGEMETVLLRFGGTPRRVAAGAIFGEPAEVAIGGDGSVAVAVPAGALVRVEVHA